MVSLTQMDKARELERQGYEHVPRKEDANMVFGGPMVFAKTERTYVFVWASGAVEPAPLERLDAWDTDLTAVERRRIAALLDDAKANILGAC